MKKRTLSSLFGAAFLCAGLGLANAAETQLFVAYSDGRIVKAEDMPEPNAKQKAERTTLRGTGITWNITYLDSGSGFDDPTEGAARKAVLNAVLNDLNAILNENGICDIEVDVSTNSPGASTLASAGSLYAISGDGFYDGLTFSHINGLSDPFPADPDMGIQVNFGKNWNTDLGTGTTSGSEFDLYSVLLHEVTHALGVASLTIENGDSQFESMFSVAAFTRYDEFLRTSANANVWNASTQAFEGGSLTGGDNTIKFSGALATASLGSDVYLYTPGSWSQGSSVSHWQFNAPTPATSVMRHAISPGVENRTYEDFEIEALQDLGYSIQVSALHDWTMY